MKKISPFLIVLLVLVGLGLFLTLFFPNVASSSNPVPAAPFTSSPSVGGGGRTAGAYTATTGYAFSDLVAQLKAGEVVSITINGQSVTVKTIDGQTHLLTWPSGDIIGTLRDFGVTDNQLAAVRVDYMAPPPAWMFTCLVGLAFMVFFVFMIRRSNASSGGGSSSGFGGLGSFGLKPSRAKQMTADQPKVTFEDVAGLEEAKEELMEVVDFLKHPEKFVALGARIPKGVILFGQPGCGKTLLARAVAGEAGVPFISISGSEFVEVFVGVGASRVRELFDQARKNAPCIVFVDEIDAVGGQRVPGNFGGGQEHNQTLNQLLKEMDGFDQTTNIVVIAATNRPEMLDPALLRSGRFDRRVAVDRPDIKARELIFGVHLRGKPLAEGVDLKKLAKATPGLTGADIENAVNEAAILAVKRNKPAIGMSELYEGIEKSVIGPERRSRTISKAEKQTIAYHEAGHAIAMHFTEGSDPVQKISIISRGFALGYTMHLPEEDRNLVSRDQILAELVGMLGGRAAEELTFGPGKITSGASNDLQRATDNVRKMVTEWGMSEKLGLRSLVPLPGSSSWEEQMRGGGGKTYSEDFARKVDEEIDRFLKEAYEQTKAVLTEHHSQLEAVVKRLIEVETIEREEFLELVSNGS